MKRAFAALAFLLLLPPAFAKRLVLIDQDGGGPGGSDQMSILVFLQSPDVEVLGITIVTGDQWRDEEVQHTLRMLEIVGRTDVPVVPGAVFPLVRTQEETRLASQLYGTVDWLGAWGSWPGQPPAHGPYEVPPLREDAPHTKPLAEDAAHFLIRQVRAHPHEVTIYAAGPLTNIAMAIAIDPQFAELTKGIVLMGGAIAVHNDDPDYATRSTHEFNFWFDPEATHIVLRANWPRVDVTTADISFKAPFTRAIVEQIAKSPHPAAQYIARYSKPEAYMWDELAACAWLDPKIITTEKPLYLDVDLSHGASYGETINWDETKKPISGVRAVHVQMELDLARFTKLFVELMSAPSAQPAH